VHVKYNRCGIMEKDIKIIIVIKISMGINSKLHTMSINSIALSIGNEYKRNKK
jgi:hypothetical protein